MFDLPQSESRAQIFTADSLDQAAEALGINIDIDNSSDHPAPEAQVSEAAELAAALAAAPAEVPAEAPAEAPAEEAAEVPAEAPADAPAEGSEAPAEGEEPGEGKPAEAEPEAPATEVPAEAPKPTEAPEEKPAEDAAEPRDTDLEGIDNPHAAPRTKQVIQTLKAKAVEARNERDRLAAEVEALKAKPASVDPEKLEELEQLRQIVRRTNIEQDPQLVKKYDQRMAANNDRVLGILKEFGLPEDKVAELKKAGISLTQLKPWLDIMEKQKGVEGVLEAADEIREQLRENLRLKRSREQEIADWQANYEKREQEAAAEAARANDEARSRILSDLTNDLAELTRICPEIKKPAAPTESDTPALRVAKQKALDAFTVEAKKVQEKVNELSKNEDLRFRVAVQGTIYRDQVVPRLNAKIASLEAQLQQLQGTAAKVRKAGSLTKTLATPAATKPATPPASTAQEMTADSLDEAARALGIQVT